ncbi:putative beta-galactosidase protein [Phaeoacremonium minimum UCRPA7]|uniref:beta-galactosidase n=1 Tax=Phaeoacremonium minimum (strain UCR-PA7) TaxID=1286976 RepID=R8BUE3_PHAM7|nr:putative beta-galactosidase protein [Phaeoacremonium minimum UCRPA7]EOO03008.1 putative beta-galactosidase protein [Phaeoacremonium minimum UCRPA7]
MFEHSRFLNLLLEDQWWLSGIFRDVYLLSFPQARIEDFKVETLLDDNYVDAILSVDVLVNAPMTVTLDLVDAQKNKVASAFKQALGTGNVNFKLDVQAPKKWTAETPYLYCAILKAGDGTQQTISQRVGFRQVEIKDGIITVNGKRIIFRGTNRHEHHPKFGRAVPYEFMRNDLIRMKLHNINAIRTSHYPNDARLYDLADELGFWIMDEADLETHGFSYVELAALTEEDKKLSKKGVISLECGRATEWITNKTEWEESYVDRQRQIVSRDKNHPSVIIWSLGNESYHGKNTIAAFNWVREHDTTRPIHYEGDRDAEVVDMYSLMYPEIPEVLQLEATSPQKKPILLCEYLYGIGNGSGAIKEYIELFYKYPRLQGGFVWQWASQGLETQTEDGETFYGYGGDFHDIINDGRENTHGYNFSDHTAKPALAELKKALEPVHVINGTATSFTFKNMGRVSHRSNRNFFSKY